MASPSRLIKRIDLIDGSNGSENICTSGCALM
jgi:hypothetical protein